FAGQDEMRSARTAAARDAHDALSLRIVTLGDIIDCVLSVCLVSVLPVHDLPRLAVEPSLLKELLSCLACQIQIDLLEMMLAVVTGNASQVHAEKYFGISNSKLVDGIGEVDQILRIRSFRIIFGLYEVASEVQRSRNRKAGLAAAG